MKCPVCSNVALLMSERQGIEIDHCPQCRGVWLDRGELDKIIERAGLETAQGLAAQRPLAGGSPSGGAQAPAPGKQSLLSELFDF